MKLLSQKKGYANLFLLFTVVEKIQIMNYDLVGLLDPSEKYESHLG